MKKLLLMLLLAFAQVNAQDTIVYRSGELTPAKVTVVETESIKFYKWNKMNGPLYSVNKNEVRKIKYQGGFIDTFNITIKPLVTLAKPVEIYRLGLDGERLSFKGRNIDDNKDLLSVIDQASNTETRIKMLDVHKQLMRNRRRQFLFGFGGLGAGIGCLAAMSISSLYTGNGNELPLAIGAVTLSATGVIIAIINKTKRVDKLHKIVELYNSQFN